MGRNERNIYTPTFNFETKPLTSQQNFTGWHICIEYKNKKVPVFKLSVVRKFSFTHTQRGLSSPLIYMVIGLDGC